VSRLKILWIGTNGVNRLNSSYYYLRTALSKQADVIPVGYAHEEKERDVAKLVKKYQPDAITLFTFHNTVNFVSFVAGNPIWKNFDKVTVPKIMFYGDARENYLRLLHAWYIYKNRFHMSLHMCKYIKGGGIEDFKKFIITSPRHGQPHIVKHFPLSVDTNIFKDYGFEREYDIFFIGATKALYGIRMRMIRALVKRAQEVKDIKMFWRSRPRHNKGWGPQMVAANERVYFRGDYAKMIGRAKIFPFCGSKWRIAVPKYYETMACNTLAVADTPLDAKELHFKAGYNYVEIDKRNYMEKIDYYLENESERKKIALNGFNTIRKYHSSDVRARELIKIIEDELL